MKKATLGHIIAFLIFSDILIVEAQKHNGHMKAILTINDFSKGGSGGGPLECSGKYYHNSIPIVALSTRWYNKGKRCFKKITIYGNGKSILWWLMNVTQVEGIEIILLMPLKLCGKTWVFLKKIGAGSKFTGPINLNLWYTVKIYSVFICNIVESKRLYQERHTQCNPQREIERG